MLTDHGTRIVKVFLHIRPDEQLIRFRNRILDPMKRWKLSVEDFRNRQKWKAYEEAAGNMFGETSTPYAPWHAIPANSIKYARVATQRALTCIALEGKKLRKTHELWSIFRFASDSTCSHDTLAARHMNVTGD